VRDANNVVVPTTITWTSETPDVASVDADGVMTALAEGTATLRATAADGVTTATWSLPTRVGVASTTASYAGNAEFGEPTDADPSDDFIVRHAEYTVSFNPTRGTPNWVSYDLDASHFGPEDRCDCFTFDPDLPASFARYTTADYTGAGAFHGYGIDRGHLARSFDRTSASLDNAHTFLFSNIVPQASDLNQGPWAALENDLGDMARFGNKEVYVIAGVAGSKGTLKNLGKIVIPASTWKVAVVMPHDHGLADVVDYRDLEVIAVDMPNDPGVRNVPWQTYRTTVQAIEAVSGYDLLARLPDKTEDIVSRGIRPPIGAVDGPYVSTEGAPVTMGAAGSLDPNGSVVSYAWDFGDGTTSTGAVVTHTFAQDGVFAVRLTVTDDDGLTDSIVTTATVANVAPVLTELPAATLLPGDAYMASGGFADPGADPWTGTVDYGDGSGPSPLALTGTTFSLFHTYRAPGTFTVTVTLSDDDVTSSKSQTVVVLGPSVAIANAIALVDQLVADGKLARGIGFVLDLELGVAKTAFDRGAKLVAAVELRSVLFELDVLVRRGALAPADAAPLRALVSGALRAI
jgi:DNA/RNA endonuclease G (NUC1)